MNRRWMMIAMIATLAGAACSDPGWSIAGNVIDANGKPVEGATLTLQCSDFRKEMPEKSDAQGRFMISRLGYGFADDCAVQADRKEGGATASATPTCTKKSTKKGQCAEGTVQLAFH